MNNEHLGGTFWLAGWLFSKVSVGQIIRNCGDRLMSSTRVDYILFYLDY